MSDGSTPKVPSHPFAALQNYIKPGTKAIVTDKISDTQFTANEHRYIPPAALLTPFSDESCTGLVNRYKDVIKSLMIPPLPLLSEERYYSYLLHMNDFPRWSFAQLVEIVDLARENSFNFIAVSSRLKHRDFSPVTCLHAFQQYANIILWKQNFANEKYTLRGTGDELNENYAQFSQAIAILAFYANLSGSATDLGEAEVARQFNIRVCLAATSPSRVYGKYAFTQAQRDILSGSIFDHMYRSDNSQSGITVLFRDTLNNTMCDTLIKSVLNRVSSVPSTQHSGHIQGSINHSQGRYPFLNSTKLQNAIIQSANNYSNLKLESSEYSRLTEGSSLASNMSEELLAAMLPDFGIDPDFINNELYGFLEEDEEKLLERPGKEQRDFRITRGCLGGLLTDAATKYRSCYESHSTRICAPPMAMSLQVDTSLSARMNRVAAEQAGREIPPHVAQINRYPMNGAMLMHPAKVKIPGHMRIELPPGSAGGRYARAPGTNTSTSTSTTTTAGAPYVMPPHAFAVSWRYRYFPRVEKGRQADQSVAPSRHKLWRQDLSERDHDRKRAVIEDICSQMYSRALYIDFPTFVKLENYIESID